MTLSLAGRWLPLKVSNTRGLQTGHLQEEARSWRAQVYTAPPIL